MPKAGAPLGTPALSRSLERNLVSGRGCVTLGRGVGGFTLTTALERHEAERMNLRPHLLDVVGVRERPGSESSLDVDGRSLAKLGRTLGTCAPHHHAMPFGAALTFAVFHPDLVRRQRKPRDRLSALRVEQFGIASEVSDESYL